MNDIYIYDTVLSRRVKALQCGSDIPPDDRPISDEVSIYNELLIKAFQKEQHVGLYMLDHRNDIIELEEKRNKLCLDIPRVLEQQIEKLVNDKSIQYIPFLIDDGEQIVIYLFIKLLRTFYVINMFDTIPLSKTLTNKFNLDVEDTIVYPCGYSEPLRSIFTTLDTAIFSIWCMCTFIMNLENFVRPLKQIDELYMDIKQQLCESYNKNMRVYLQSYGNYLLDRPVYDRLVDTDTYLIPKAPSPFVRNKSRYVEENPQFALGSRWKGKPHLKHRAFDYLMRKHSNFCTFNYKYTGSTSDEYDDIPTIDWIYSYDGKISLLIDDVNLKEIQNCLQNDKRFIMIFLRMCREKSIDKRKCHANMLLYDKYTAELERFDPQGTSKDKYGEYSKDMDRLIAEKLRSIMKIKTYYKPIDFCPVVSFQNLEEKQFRNKKYEPGGYCGAWSIWFADLRLSNPNVDRRDIVEYAISKIPLETSFRQFIRNYSDYLVSL